MQSCFGQRVQVVVVHEDSDRVAQSKPTGPKDGGLCCLKCLSRVLNCAAWNSLASC